MSSCQYEQCILTRVTAQKHPCGNRYQQNLIIWLKQFLNMVRHIKGSANEIAIFRQLFRLILFPNPSAHLRRRRGLLKGY
jgi:hypothetical protein